MTPQPGQQTITTLMLPNISRSKDNQTMKFGQLIEYNKKDFFFNNHAENKAGRPVPDLFLIFVKALYLLLQVVCSLVSMYFDSLQLEHAIKTNCIKL